MESLRTFILWREHKRVYFNEEDIKVERISSVFMVDGNGVYLQDDYERLARFPDYMGEFDTSGWRNRSSIEVMGQSSQNELPSVSPQDFGLSTSIPSTSGIASTSTADQSVAGGLIGRKPNTFRMSLQKGGGAKGKDLKNEFRRKIFFVEFTDDDQAIPLSTAYLRLKKDEANVKDVARLTMEYLNIEDELIITDVNGFEILDSQATRGADFWDKGTMKVYACTDVVYEQLRINRYKKANTSKGKGKARRLHPYEKSQQDNTTAILDRLDEIEDQMKMAPLLYSCRKIEEYDKVLREAFKCNICLNIVKDEIEFSGCCNRLVACTSCANQWYTDNTVCYHCRSEDGVSQRKTVRGLENLFRFLQSQQI